MAPTQKIAVVTGCNRGIGLAVARRLVQEGFVVVAACRKKEDARKTAKSLGSGAFPVQLDLAKGEAAIRAAASQVMEWLDGAKLQVLVNNAGNSYGSWDDASWEDSRAVNYRGAICLTEALLPGFAHAAAIMMVGSGLGELKLICPKYQTRLKSAMSLQDLDKIASLPIDRLWDSWVGPYGLSKALLHRATEILAADTRYSDKAITVNARCPGWVATDMGGEQAPITPEEGAWHILEPVLAAPSQAVTGTYKCYCYKNYDEEHNASWEKKWGDRSKSQEGKRQKCH